MFISSSSTDDKKPAGVNRLVAVRKTGGKAGAFVAQILKALVATLASPI
jgi:hypothetical protein